MAENGKDTREVEEQEEKEILSNLKWITETTFEFELEDERGIPTGEKARGKVRPISVKFHRTIEKILKEIAGKPIHLDQLFTDKEVEVETEQGETKVEKKSPWDDMSYENRREFLHRVISLQNPHLESDQLDSLPLVEAQSVYLAMMPREVPNPRDTRFLSDLQNLITKLGTAKRAGSSGLTQIGTATEK